jgi:hypothetical protein
MPFHILGSRYAGVNDFVNLIAHARANENAHRLLRLAGNDHRAHQKTPNHDAGK